MNTGLPSHRYGTNDPFIQAARAGVVEEADLGKARLQQRVRLLESLVNDIRADLETLKANLRLLVEEE